MSMQIASLFASIGADTSGLERGLQATKSGLEGAGKSFGSFMLGVNQTLQVAQQVAQAIKVAYDAAKEGAALEYAAGKFDRLTTSIGSTSNVLLGDLRSATKGMMSDAELMASAADFMSLGFADTADEVVRLTTVAGALDMNMNQLVLTLANQTTMRFDQLGVAVAGFDEKVKALEATGMSASDAFQEAFLQQAEEQIGKVGNAADSAVAPLQQMETAFKNLSDTAKMKLAGSFDDTARSLTNIANEMTKNEQAGILLYDVMDQLNGLYKSETIDRKTYNSFLRDMGVHSNAGAVSLESVADAQQRLNAISIASGQTIDSTSSSMIAQSIAAKQNADGITMSEDALKSWIAEQERLLQIQTDLANVTSLSANFSSIIGFAEQYTVLQEQINQKQAEYDAMPGWKQASKDGQQLLTDIENLQGGFSKLANQMTLDMFKATIAIGGVTDAEMDAYLKMAVDMGVISQDAADAAMEAYGDAVETINGYEIDEKTGNVDFDLTAAFAALEILEAYQLQPKRMRVFISTNWGAFNEGNIDPYENYTGPVYTHAVGGPAYTNSPYIVGERGPELFVPQGSGYIMTNAQTANALDGGGGSGLLGDILFELQSQPARIKVAVKEAMALVGG